MCGHGDSRSKPRLGKFPPLGVRAAEPAIDGTKPDSERRSSEDEGRREQQEDRGCEVDCARASEHPEIPLERRDSCEDGRIGGVGGRRDLGDLGLFVSAGRLCDSRERLRRHVGHRRDVLRGGVSGEEAHTPEAELLAIGWGFEGDAAVSACAIARFDRVRAGVADAEQIGDGGATPGEHPELPGCGAAEGGFGGDSAATDEGAEGLEGAAGAEWLGVVADEPGAHGVLGGLA